MFDPQRARQAQVELCRLTAVPHFAPESGRCWRCGKDIYTEVEHKNPATGATYKTGYSVEYASEHLVTGCPHCNRSYCD